jgi:aminoglycoside phosphotransferase (APT) family kinase protein
MARSELAPARVAVAARAGQLDDLLDPDAATTLIASAGLAIESVTPTYLRLKPGHSALVGFTLRGEGPTGEVAVEAYARTFEGDEARTIAAKWPAERSVPTPLGAGVTLLPGGRTILFQFPNDGALRHLPAVATADRLRRLLTGVPELAGLRVQAHRSVVRPVRWKPERRFVGAADLRVADDETGRRERRELHLRWFPDARAEFVGAATRHLATHGLPVADQVGVVDGGRLHLERSLPGVDGAAALLAGDLEVGAVLDLLERLRRCPPMAGPIRRPLEPDRSARAALGLLATAAPDLEPLAGRVAATLQSTSDALVGIVHGDLHLHQLVVDGGDIALVDLERAGIGHPLLDVASLLAHVIDLAHHDPTGRAELDRFLHEVVEHTLRETRSGAGTLSLLLRGALVERALLALRRLDPGWRCTVEALLRRAIGEDDGAVWEVLHPRPSGIWTGWRRLPGGGEQPGTYEPVTGAFVDRAAHDDGALPGLLLWAGRGTVVSHRPGRRAVLRLDEADGDAFVKVVRPKRAEGVLASHMVAGELRCRHPRSVPVVPAVVESAAESGVVILRQMPGRPLHDTLMSRDGSQREAAIATVARSLVALRELDVTDAGLGPAADGGDADAWLGLIAMHRPALADDYSDVRSTLPMIGALLERPALVHGDLHDRNVFLVDGEIGLVDLDSLGVGDPGIDAGNLAAHLVLRAMQRGDAPQTGHAEAATFLAALDAGRREWAWTANVLFRLACIYRFRRRWSHLTGALLDAVRTCSESR